MVLKEIDQLKWQIEIGADEALEENPVNKFTAGTARDSGFAEKKETYAAQEKTVTPQNNMKDITVISPIKAAKEAREIADKVRNLKELEEAVRNFNGCSIKKTATNTVFADGNAASRIMLVGEAPGANEDVEGIPFCGQSGKLLDEVLFAIGLDRTKFYITNTVFWRPPGNRKPTQEELDICRPFVEKHVALVNPKILLLVGGTAVEALLGIKQGITGLRGKFYEYSNGYIKNKVKTMATYHPSYLLRQPTQKKSAWQDALLLKKAINS